MTSAKTRIFKNVISSILIVLIFFVSLITIVNVSFKLIYLETQVRGFSMKPTININIEDPNAKGDTIFVNKYCSFTNNDIVVAKVKWYEHYIIKRVVGTPNDKVQIKDEKTHYAVYVNDIVLYTKEKTGSATSFPRTGSVGYYADYLSFLNNPEFQRNGWVSRDSDGNKYIQLGENDYFLMGDNWGHTTDCISEGPIKACEIIGKVDLIIDVENKNDFSSLWFFIKNLFKIN